MVALRDSPSCQGPITTTLTAHATLSRRDVSLGITITTTVDGIPISTVLPPAHITTSSATPNLTTVSKGTKLCDPQIVFWASKEMSLFPSDYSTSIASIIRVPLATIPVTIDNTTPTALPKPHSKSRLSLSPGAKAGIIVGSLADLLLLGLAAAVVTRKIRRYRASMRSETLPPELPGETAGWKTFLGGRWRAEKEVVSEPQELESRSVVVVPGPPAELEARGIGTDIEEQTLGDL